MLATLSLESERVDPRL
ncbi:hypothetical protein E2R58_21845 [Paenibacillus amylolyticus]|nr:hypothetical protein E2R58_21845 [Paenibacillus amylolyticus]